MSDKADMHGSLLPKSSYQVETTSCIATGNELQQASD